MSIRAKLKRQDGVALVTALGFMMVFVVLAVALFMLLTGARNSTELERKEVKAFNVAEAGIDAGMYALKQAWPEDPTATATRLDTATLREALQSSNPQLYLSQRKESEEQAQEQFLRVDLYDNSKLNNGQYETITVPDPTSEGWDANQDGMMFVDSRANVDNDYHRIIVMAQRQAWPLDFPGGCAMWANEAGGNGQGLRVYIDPESPVKEAQAYRGTELGKGIKEGPGVTVSGIPEGSTFDDIVTPETWEALRNIAVARGTYFTSEGDASTFLSSGDAGGNIVYVEAESAVTVSGSVQIGSRTNPLILVLDTPEDADNTIDLRGTSDFYGIVLVRGNALMRGTSSIWGQMLCSGTIEAKGNGSSPEINYNSYVLDNLNRDFTVSVGLVPNTWEEYTVAE